MDWNNSGLDTLILFKMRILEKLVYMLHEISCGEVPIKKQIKFIKIISCRGVIRTKTNIYNGALMRK